MTYRIGPVAITKKEGLFDVFNSSRGDFNSVTFTHAELIRLRFLIDAAIADHSPKSDEALRAPSCQLCSFWKRRHPQDASGHCSQHNNDFAMEDDRCDLFQPG